MRKLIFIFPFFLISNEPKVKKDCNCANLVKNALSARKNSYSPYSKYKVGSAIKCPDGKIYSGTNVENASYGMTICAERSAIFSAVSEGKREFDSIVVITKDGKGFPCGGCRQVLNEFNPNMQVILAD